MKLAQRKSYIKSSWSLTDRCGGRFLTGYPAVALAAFAVAMSVGATEIAWQPQNGSTDISDPNNWFGGNLPGNGDNKYFTNKSGGADYTVKIPVSNASNPYLDKSGLNVGGLGDGQKVTLDATGAYWLQMGEAGTTWSGDKVMRLYGSGGNHIFNIEGLNAANANDNFGFTLADGVISFKRDSVNGDRLVFEGGTFNNAILPDGVSQPQHTTILLYDTAPNARVELAGGSVTFREVNVRGNSPGGEVLVSSGDHHIVNGLKVGVGGNNSGNTAVFHVEGGKVTLDSYCLWITKDANSQGELRIDGSGVFEMGAGASLVYFPDASTKSGLLSIGGNGVYRSQSSTMCAGHNGGTANILVKDNGFFDHAAYLQLPENDNGTINLTVTDNGRVYASNATVASTAGSQVSFDLSGDSVTRIQQGTVAKNATANFSLSMSDNAVLRLSDSSGTLNFGDNNGGNITLNLEGGMLAPFDDSSDVLNNVVFKGGPNSVYNFAGVDMTANNMVVQGVQNGNAADRASYTNTVRIAGGTINVVGTGLDIQGYNRNCMLLVEGGVLNVNATYTRVGHGGASSGWHSIIRQTGGEINFASGKVVNLCDNATDGEIELFGGVMTAYQVRGWNQSEVRNASSSAKATLYGNGGTLAPWQNDSTFLGTMSAVYVGERGLTVDSRGFSNVQIRAKVVNKDDQDGLFVKKGAGTLKVSLKETDGGAKGNFANRSLAGEQTYTRVDAGKMVFTDVTDAVFGRNVAVKGGATLSLEGTPETLTVDTLTLGDGRGFAVLKLEAGDTVVVNGANGITAACGVLDVPWKSTEGTHAVFTCKQGVTASELDKISILDADAAKDYAWTTEVDAGTGYTICSVVVAPAGTLTKTITYAEGSVTTNGTGLVAGIVATSDSAQSGPLALAHTVTASVDDGKTLSLGGPLVGSGVELCKTGSGLLTVGGSNPDFYGSFVSRGGLFAVDNVGAFGPAGDIYFPLVLGGGTFRYTGADEAVFAGGLRIAAGAKKQQVILDNDGDMTFKSTEYVQGGFVKIGTGTLKFDLPAGTFALGSGDNSENIGANAGQADLPANGDSPTSMSGLYGVTILEGTMKVVGEGRSATTLETRNRALLGGGYPAEKAAKLVVENARVNWGSGSRSGAFCHDLPANIPAPEIALTNAMLWSDSPVLGRYEATKQAVVKLLMKDSEYYGHYNSQVGGDTIGVTVDADNSQMHSNGMIGWTVQARVLDADFYGVDAEFASFDKSTTNNGSAGMIHFYNWVTGELKIRDGAALRTTRGVKMNNATLGVVFDGGRFEISPHDNTFNATSVWNNVAGTGFTAAGGGMEIRIAEGMTHAFNFPIKGAGSVVKTGAGTFKLVAARAEGEKLVQYTGGTVVSNGTLVVDGSLVADGAKTFGVCAGATLDLNDTTLAGAKISDAGTVTNGTLSAATLAYAVDAVPTFSDVAFDGTLTVDFGRTAEDPLDAAEARAGIVVAHYTGEAPANLSIRAANTGIERAKTEVTLSGGDIIATVAPSGFMVIVR